MPLTSLIQFLLAMSSLFSQVALQVTNAKLSYALFQFVTNQRLELAIYSKYIHLAICDELAEIKVCDELSQITAAMS